MPNISFEHSLFEHFTKKLFSSGRHTIVDTLVLFLYCLGYIESHLSFYNGYFSLRTKLFFHSLDYCNQHSNFLSYIRESNNSQMKVKNSKFRVDTNVMQQDFKADYRGCGFIVRESNQQQTGQIILKAPVFARSLKLTAMRLY